MSIDAEQLIVQVGANTTSADQTLAQFATRASEQLATIETKIDGLGSGGASGGGAGGGVDDFFNKFLSYQVVLQAGQAVAGFVSHAVDAYAANERLDQSLQTLVAREMRNADATLSMGDALDQAAPKAAELLKWNEQLAINSPFDEAGIAAAFRTAEGYGFVSESADKTAISAKRLTQDLVDFAAGSGRTSETVNQVALALGQIEAKGKVAGQEVLQLVNAGIPVDQILAKAFNKSTAEIVALREQGLIPADQAVKAIAYSLENDFGGAAERQSGTMSGLLNSLSDLQTIGSRDLLGPAIKEVQPILQTLVDTLNSPEGKENIQAIGKAIGDIVGGELPLFVHDMQDLAASVKDAYTDVMGLVDAYNQIKDAIPSGREVGEMMGFGGLHQAYAALQSGDIPGYLTNLVNGTAQVTTATNDLTAATGAGTRSAGEWSDATQDAAYQQQTLALSTQASTEDLAKFQTQLDKAGQTGQAAYEKLADSQQQFQQADGQRASDHQDRLTAIDAQAQEQRATRHQNYNDADADRSAAYLERVRQLNETAARQESDTQATEHDRQVQAVADRNDKLQGIIDQGRARTVQNIQADQARDQAYQERTVEIATQNAEKITDLQSREHDRQLSAAQSYQDRATQLVQRASDLQTQYVEAAADRAQQAADQLADRQQQYAQRTADLQSTAAENQQTNDEQFQEDKQTRLGDHTDRLSDLQEQLNAATDAKQKASIQKQIDAEDERYAKQEAKAQTAYERQSEKAAVALQRQLDQAAQAEARQEEQDAKALQKQEDTAAKQLAKQQAALLTEQQSQDAAYAASEAKASAAYARQIAAQDTAAATQLAKLQDTHAKQVAADEAKYQADVAHFRAAYDAEVDSYTKSEAKQAQHLETQRITRFAAAAQQLAELNSAYVTQEGKAKEAYDKQEAAANLARQKQIAAENTSFARAEAAAQASYEKQQAQLDTALGKQLLAYTDIQLKMSAITSQQAQQRQAIIAAEFGVDPQAAQQQFAAILAQLTPAAPAADRFPTRGGDAGLAIHGDVNINLPQGTNVNDPVALANATQRALLQLQNRNGGTGLQP